MQMVCQSMFWLRTSGSIRAPSRSTRADMTYPNGHPVPIAARLAEEEFGGSCLKRKLRLTHGC